MTAAAPSLATPTVLYVEDESDDIFFMRTAFAKLGMESQFHAVDDGSKAIAWLAGEGPYVDRAAHPLPRVILLDLNLPLRSGFEVLQWLREDGRFQELIVVIFSSSGRPEDRTRASELGATDYVLKPQSGFQFLEVVRRLGSGWMGGSSPS